MRQQLGSSVEYFERDLTAKILPAGRMLLAAASTNITESHNVKASNATAHQLTPKPANSTTSSSESSPAAADIKEKEASIQPVPSTCPLLGLSAGLQPLPACMLGAVIQSLHATNNASCVRYPA